MLASLAVRLSEVTARFVPSAFAIALILTFVTFALAFGIAGASPSRIIIEWGNGFWTLVPFAMQMALVVLSGYLVSTAPVVDRGFARLAGLARSPRGAVVLMALVSMGLAWVHWGLSLVGCAMFVRHVVRAEPRVDYRLLVCAAYFGMGATWHAGLSASAPLLVATPGHFLESTIGLIPVSATIFSPFNLGLTLVVVSLLVVLAAVLHPRAGEARPIDPGLLERLERFEPPRPPDPSSVASRLDHSRALTLAVAVCGAGWLAWYVASKGFALTLDVLNFTFIMLAVLLHPSAASLLAASERGAGLMAGVVLQFPFYAGMYGVIQGTDLARMVGEAIAAIATPETLPVWLYWYSGLVNYFVPSGGSKWAIEAPYLVDAATRLGVPTPQVVLAYAWGDMATDIIQPFWALPLLAAARVDFRDIMGYAAIVFMVYTVVVSCAFWLMPSL
ncbi:MAG: short-chain fatty acid transporter [Acidobacteria bacterium]|nr:short-chain fatty acid transporter [Acidobacteriota bacterium]